MDTDSVASEVTTEQLIAAARLLADRHVFGVVWIDPDLIVRARFGPKASFVALGRPITYSVFAFIGVEETIARFQDDPSQSLELPGVVIVAGADEQNRYNLSIFWSAAQRSYVLLIARASIDATLEIELLRHVRARLMAEAEIKAKSAELARANRDLENFAALISHDLKAPMRALQYKTGDLEAALEQGDLAQAREHVDWMAAQARRMSSMLTGLLDYSTIGRKSQAIETVATGALAEAIAASLPRHNGVDIRVEGTWPDIATLRAPLDLVLRNLLDNAIKHHDRPGGRVRLVCDAKDTALNISVIDDGPGIPADHAAAVFLPFRTLKPEGAATSAGIGMGLSHVQRTVEGIGGRISLTSPVADGRGARFDVVWPRVLDIHALKL